MFVDAPLKNDVASYMMIGLAFVSYRDRMDNMLNNGMKSDIGYIRKP